MLLLWVIPWLVIAQPRLIKQQRVVDTGVVPDLREILREGSLWGANPGHFCANQVWLLVRSWIPYSLVHEPGWSITPMAKIDDSADLRRGLMSMLTGLRRDPCGNPGAAVHAGLRRVRPGCAKHL